MKIKYSIHIFSWLGVIILFSSVLRFDAFFEDSNRYIPYRIVVLCSLIFLAITFFRGHKFKRDTVILLVILMAVVIFLHFFWLRSFDSAVEFINSLLSYYYVILGSVMTVYFCKYYSFDGLLSIRRYFLTLSSIIFIVETGIRFLYPELALADSMDPSVVKERMVGGPSSDNFFYFKYGSIMFHDSNYVGLNAIPLLILSLVNKDRRILFSSIFSVIILFSLSRSAWIVTILIFAIWFIRANRFLINAMYMFGIPLSLAAIYVLYGVVSEDRSFLTKVALFSALGNASDIPLTNFLFGFGYEIGSYIYSPGSSAYAHALIPLLLGEVGLVGMIVFFLSWSYLIYRFGFVVFLNFVAMFVCGLSLGDPWELIYYVVPIFSAYMFRRAKQVNMGYPDRAVAELI